MIIRTKKKGEELSRGNNKLAFLNNKPVLLKGNRKWILYSIFNRFMERLNIRCEVRKTGTKSSDKMKTFRRSETSLQER